MALCEVRTITGRMVQGNEYGTQETINSIGTGKSGISYRKLGEKCITCKSELQ